MAEDKGGAAVFPAGLILRLEDDGVVLGNKGDVVIEGDLTGSLGKIKHVFSQSGSLTVTAPNFAADRIEALEGEIDIKGNIKAARIKGQKVSIGEGKAIAQVILADVSIDLTGKSVKADVVVAPQVSFGTTTKGRVTAVDCENELGPSKVKGRFSLADYVDMVANAVEVLQANDIPVPEGDEDDDEEDEPEEKATAPPAGGAEDEESEGDAELNEELLQSQDLEGDAGADAPDEAAGEPPAAEGVAESSLSEEEAKELTEQLEKALDKINEAYQKGEVPPPIVFLQSLVAEKRFDYIKMQINSIWSDLLKYHQKKGLYISNSVTHQFQQIQMLMRRLPSA